MTTMPRYEVRIANSSAEIETACRLRFDVFNVEMGIGLDSSVSSGIDRDAFDEVCEHLVAYDNQEGCIVGTYRMQTGVRAGGALGYYSERQFNFAAYEDRRASILELGRACVRKDHRNFTVIGLLWRGIVEYALARECRYLLGCSSVTSQDPALGWAMYRRFEREDQLAGEDWQTLPKAAFVLPDALPLAECPAPPRLLSAYLGVGARICSHPALDREFKTIVFLTMLDCFHGSPAATGRFLDRPLVAKA
jgi:putative hemolysin